MTKHCTGNPNPDDPYLLKFQRKKNYPGEERTEKEFGSN